MRAENRVAHALLEVTAYENPSGEAVHFLRQPIKLPSADTGAPGSSRNKIPFPVWCICLVPILSGKVLHLISQVWILQRCFVCSINQDSLSSVPSLSSSLPKQTWCRTKQYTHFDTSDNTSAWQAYVAFKVLPGSSEMQSVPTWCTSHQKTIEVAVRG